MSLQQTRDTAASLRIANVVIEDQALDHQLALERIASLEEDRDIVLEMYRGALRAIVTLTAERDREIRRRESAEAQFQSLCERLLLEAGVAA